MLAQHACRPGRGLTCLALLSVWLLGCSSLEQLGKPPVRRAEMPRAIDTVAFGSCLKAYREAPVFDDILAASPDVMLMLGDNVYADLPEIPRDRWDYRAKYDELGEQDYWQRFRAQVPVLATWDDHDYGRNDAGVDWWLKEEAKLEYMRFFSVPARSPMRSREGIYQVSMVGPPGRRVQLILLDLRTFKDKFDQRLGGVLRPGGPYVETDDTSRTLMGEAQWQWLERQLRRPADVRLIASSIQVVAEDHGWEGWDKFPHERRRLYELLGRTQADGVIFLSGDRHHAEISLDREAMENGAPYPIWDLTASGLNQSSDNETEFNRHRLGQVYHTTNFGLIHIDWSRADPLVTLQVRGRDGIPFNSQQLRLSELRPAEGDAAKAAGP